MNKDSKTQRMIVSFVDVQQIFASYSIYAQFTSGRLVYSTRLKQAINQKKTTKKCRWVHTTKCQCQYYKDAVMPFVWCVFGRLRKSN